MKYCAASASRRADQPGRDQLGVGVDRSPRPDVASLRRSGLGPRDVLLLAMDEGPDFIDLHPLARQVP